MILFGTCIITIINQDSIWIGADNKRYSVEKNLMNEHSTQNQKIFEKDGFYFFFCGISQAYDHNKNIYFDPQKIMDSAITEFKEYNDVYENFTSQIPHKLNLVTNQTLKNNPKYFLSEMLNKPPIFGGQLIQFTKGIKKIKTFDYCIVGTNQNNWTVREQPSSLTSDTFITFSGTYTNAQNYFMQNFRSLYPSSDYKKLITDLIRIEAQNNNYKVGMPVNVLAIQNDSHTWYLDNY